MESGAGVTGDLSTGEKLFAAGCRQGALIELPGCAAWLTASVVKIDGADWTVQMEQLKDTMFVVSSQDCDICAADGAEPCVEALEARLTSDKQQIFTARKGNSFRLFLLEQHQDGRALVADARRRVLIAKPALERAGFRGTFSTQRDRQRFADWVAGRYNRPAVSNAVVAAVLKPIQTKLGEVIAGNSALKGVLDRVSEIRFAVPPNQPPWVVSLLVLIDEGDSLNVEEEAELLGWLEDTLVSEAVTEIEAVVRSPTTVSVYDYLAMVRMSLDHYTPEAA